MLCCGPGFCPLSKGFKTKAQFRRGAGRKGTKIFSFCSQSGFRAAGLVIVPGRSTWLRLPPMPPPAGPISDRPPGRRSCPRTPERHSCSCLGGTTAPVRLGTWSPLSSISGAAHSTIQRAQDSFRMRLRFLRDKFKSVKVKILNHGPHCSALCNSPQSGQHPVRLGFPLWSRSFLRTPRWPSGASGHKPGAHVSLFCWWFGGCLPSLVSVCVVEVKMDNSHYLLHSRGGLVTHHVPCCRDSMLSQTTKVQECYLCMNLCMKKDKLLFRWPCERCRIR